MNRRQLSLAALASTLPLSLHAQDSSASGDIVVAQIGPFTVLPAPDAHLLNEGFKAAIADVNASGGINGRRIRLLTLDDAYSYEGFVKQLGVARQQKAVALLTPIGSATLTKALETRVFDAQDLAVINAIPGAAVLRTPGHPMWFHVRAGDHQQIEKIVSHARTTGYNSMGVLYQNIPMGSSGLSSAQAAAKAMGGMDIVGIESAPDAASMAAAAEKMAAARAQTALVVGAPRFAGEGLAALRKAGLTQQLFTLSYLPAAALVKFAGDGARGVGIAQTFPNPSGVRIGLQRSFAQTMRTHAPDVKVWSAFHMEAFVCVQLLAAAARRASSVNGVGLANALHKLGEVNLGGFQVDFSKGNVGSKWVDIAVVDRSGKLMY